MKKTILSITAFGILVLSLIGCGKENAINQIEGTYKGTIRIDVETRINATTQLVRNSNTMVSLTCSYGSNTIVFDSLRISRTESNVYQLSYLGHNPNILESDFEAKVDEDWLTWGFWTYFPWVFNGQKTIQ